jgi:TRAP-type mannitol/chloroaromatic compound transport system substrate-binding protein
MLAKVARPLAVGLIAAVAAFGPQAASAQDKKVRAQMAGAFPSSMQILGPAQKRTVELINKLSGGSIDIKFFEPGALVPGSQYFDAVSNGSLDMAYTAAGYFTGKDIVFAMFTTVPFGPDAAEFLAWYEYGGGNELMWEMHAKYNIVARNCGIISPEASGWFRKEIKTLDDLKGLKMRFFGLGANVMQKMGVATQLLQAGEIFQALQLGTIDATEFSMPTMDLSLGFHQVAKYYYFPGWHQQATFFDLYINKKRWEALADRHKAVIELACGDMVRASIAEGEAMQWKAMREMQAAGVQIRRWPNEMIAALESAWNEVAAEEAQRNPNFQRLYESYLAFRRDYAIWNEHAYLR